MDDFVLVDDLSLKPPPASASHYDAMFDSYLDRFSDPKPPPSRSPSPPPSPPVFDKPVFDDEPDPGDPVGAIPVLGGGGEDYLDSLGKAAKPVAEEARGGGGGGENGSEFDRDLIPGFGASTSSGYTSREPFVPIQEKESVPSATATVSTAEDPFVILGTTSNSENSSFGLFTDPWENLGRPIKSDSRKIDTPSNSGETFEDSDIFGEIRKLSAFSIGSEKKSERTDNRPLGNINSANTCNQGPLEEPVHRCTVEAFGELLPDMDFSKTSDFHETLGSSGAQTSESLAKNMHDQAPKGSQYCDHPDDVWLIVSDIVLVTQPTSAPPPARPPPPLAGKLSPTESDRINKHVHQPSRDYDKSKGSTNKSKASPIVDLEDVAMANPEKFANGHRNVFTDEDVRKFSTRASTSSMDWAEVKHTKGLNEGKFDFEQRDIDEKTIFHGYDMENREKSERLECKQKQREKEEEERRENERKELEREREKARQMEEEEQKRREKEKEARQAMKRAVREARERAAAEARMRAEKEARQRAERAAVQKAAAEARGRAAAQARERVATAAAEARERAAAEARERASKVAAEARERASKVSAEASEWAARAAAEARERAAAEARERAVKADAEARDRAAAEACAKAEQAAVEKATAEARRRAERAAVERVATEARQRAANEARERAAAEARARENHKRAAECDLESIFGTSSWSSGVSRPPNGPTNNPFDAPAQGSTGSGAVRRTSSASASTFTQTSSNNLMDDLSSIFRAPSPFAVVQEIGGESAERRKARLERQQRTMERAAKALAEKNERDLQIQRDQEERHRIGETFDSEIKRWAAGKEGNLRALLSTLQYILWPECGWRPISLTDLITAASVKKEYRKATLCIHPDKVQQKGANLQQKYIAEKVFDLLKEAWNKFNSEELF